MTYLSSFLCVGVSSWSISRSISSSSPVSLAASRIIWITPCRQSGASSGMASVRSSCSSNVSGMVSSSTASAACCCCCFCCFCSFFLEAASFLAASDFFLDFFFPEVALLLEDAPVVDTNVSYPARPPEVIFRPLALPILSDDNSATNV